MAAAQEDHRPIQRPRRVMKMVKVVKKLKRRRGSDHPNRRTRAKVRTARMGRAVMHRTKHKTKMAKTIPSVYHVVRWQTLTQRNECLFIARPSWETLRYSHDS